MRVYSLNARKNLRLARDRLGELLTPEGETSLRYFAVQFAEPPAYFASSAFIPEWDFYGKKLQDLRGLDEFHPICFSAWAKGNESVVVFCWHKSADVVCKPFIDSLRESKPHRLANRILGMAFEYCDNIAFRHDWWESIPNRDQQYLAKRVLSGVEDSSRTEKSLFDGGLRSLKSEVVTIKESP